MNEVQCLITDVIQFNHHFRECFPEPQFKVQKACPPENPQNGDSPYMQKVRYCEYRDQMITMCDKFTFPVRASSGKLHEVIQNRYRRSI